MKKKFDKILTERPRKGARFKLNRMRDRNGQELPTKIGVRRHRKLNGTHSKFLNENLSPLRRYLMKQAGRPWDKVYSEICEGISLDNEVQRHILLHIEDFVAVNVYVDNEGVWRNSSRNWYFHWPEYGPVLYVDPNDGILKRTKKLCRKLGIVRKGWRDRDIQFAKARASGRPKRKPESVRSDDGKLLKKLDGLWFEMMPEDKKAKARRKQISNINPNGAYDPPKRQLSKKELKQYGLENGP